MDDERAVVLPRRLDVATSADVRASLHAALDGGTGDLVIDLRDVEVVDAAGLGVLVGARRRAIDSGRAVVLLSTPLRVRRLLGATHLARLFVIDDGFGVATDPGEPDVLAGMGPVEPPAPPAPPVWGSGADVG